MRKHLSGKRHGYPLLIGRAAIVLAFMGLSLAVTATGTARFAVAMGYRAEVGYAVFISHALGAYGRQALEVHLLELFSSKGPWTLLHQTLLGLAPRDAAPALELVDPPEPEPLDCAHTGATANTSAEPMRNAFGR